MSATPGASVPPPTPPKTYLIIGASRGIGLELCRQLLDANQRVIATARKATGSSQLWALTGTENGGNLSILECDVADEQSVGRFVPALRAEMGKWKRLSGGVAALGGGAGRSARGVIDVCIVNAGVLVYPNRVMEISFAQFAHHLTTNTIGPLLLAASLLRQTTSSTAAAATPTPPPPPLTIHTLAFMSSDSGSAARFRSFEDGFAAYAASKAALNQGLRHLAAELQRLPPADPARHTVVLALHPGEVATDMASGADVAWDVEGIISPRESVSKLLAVVADKGWAGPHQRGGQPLGVATFWDWEGRPYPW